MNELELRIKECAQAYYEGEPLISDIEFDSLILQLKAECPTSVLLSTPGWGYSIENSHLKKFKHTFVCGSLDKINVQHILSGIHKWYPQRTFIASSKLDGNSCVLYYKDGKFIRALSRGNGDYGCDISDNIKHAIPLTISAKWVTAIRGEIILTYSNFNKIGGSHPRNMATGLSQSKNCKPEDVQLLSFIPYWVKDYQEGENHNLNVYSFLTTLGFTSIPVSAFHSFSEFVAEIGNDINAVKNYFTLNGDLPIDGLVLTDEDGNQIAVKFEDESMVTTVTNVVFSVSRTGRIVPVLHVNPVNLRGANISKVTANNVTWLQEQGCGVGATIEIVRANEVIPKVVNVIQKTAIALPTVCPACSSTLENYNRDLICVNDDCSSKIYKMYFNIFDSVKIDGIGPAVIDAILEGFELNSIEAIKDFLENFDYDKVLEILKPAKTALFMDCIDAIKHKPITLKQLILNANIPNVGDSCTDAISGWCYGIGQLLKSNGDLPEEVFPTYLARDNFKKYFERIVDLVFFYNSTNILLEADKIVDKTINVTITGALSMPRDRLLLELNAVKPGVVVKEVSIGKADYLLTNSTDLTSSKGKAALQKGIPIVSELEFRNILCA